MILGLVISFNDPRSRYLVSPSHLHFSSSTSTTLTRVLRADNDHDHGLRKRSRVKEELASPSSRGTSEPSSSKRRRRVPPAAPFSPPPTAPQQNDESWPSPSPPPRRVKREPRNSTRPTSRHVVITDLTGDSSDSEDSVVDLGMTRPARLASASSDSDSDSGSDVYYEASEGSASEEERPPLPTPANSQAKKGKGKEGATGSSQSPIKLKRATEISADGSVTVYGWPDKVAVAPESMYEDYEHLDDLLLPGLDLVFVGINPGKKASEEGHFFAHPSNRFWKALHGSGLSPRQYAPYEDIRLPQDLGIGLTTLIERITSVQAELTAAEHRIATYSLVKKLSENGPRVACLLGKGMWEQVESVIKKTATPATSAEWSDSDDEEILDPYHDVSPVAKKGQGKWKGKAAAKGKGKAKVKMVKPKPPKQTFEYDKPQIFRLASTADGGFTYLWVVPSTSGLVSKTVMEMVDHFAYLKNFVDRRKRGTGPLPPGDSRRVEDVFWDVDLDGVKKSCEEERVRVEKKREAAQRAAETSD